MTLHARERSLSNCQRCSYCRWVPSQNSEDFAHICPSIRYGVFHSYSGGGKSVTAFGLMHGVIDYDDKVLDSIFACSACGGCETACNATLDDLVEPMENIYALRQKVVEDGKLPKALAGILTNLRHTGHPEGTEVDRGAWCGSAPEVGKAGADILVLTGDMGLDPAMAGDLTTLLERLRAAKANFALAGAAEPSAGGLAFEIGDQALARDMMQKLAAYVAGTGARTILTPDGALYAALVNYARRLEVEIGAEVEHASEWLAANPAPETRKGEVVTYHDSCRLGRLGEPFEPWSGEREIALSTLSVREGDVMSRRGNGGLYEAPRKAVTATGATITEMPRSREASFCCGLGGGAKAFSPDFAASAAKHRLEEAASTGAEVMVTSCADCAGHMQAVADAEGIKIKVESLMTFTKGKG